MISPVLTTDNPQLTLVSPKVERDAPMGVKWLDGEQGRDTLRLMGVTNADNRPSTLEEEKARVQGFIDDPKHMVWMMNLSGSIVGVVEVSFKTTEYLPMPIISIMIGDPAVRGKGLGYATTSSVLNYLVRERHFARIYARYLTTNTASQTLFEKLGFHAYGEQYTDADGLSWQNVEKGN